MNNRFAIELIIIFPETIEEKIRRILTYISKKNDIKSIEISEIEATGSLGNKLSDKYESCGKIKIQLEEFFQLVEEKGQIIELNTVIVSKQKNKYNILVVRGDNLNILSNDFNLLEKDIIGPFNYLDLGLFNQGSVVSD